MSIKKISFPIPTKLQKKVNQISRYFKIKDIFLALGAKKIDQIQNIVNGNPKLKPCIQITTKGLSRKQIITPISSNNTAKFMKNSSLYVTNINMLLRNAKSEVLVDFI